MVAEFRNLINKTISILDEIQLEYVIVGGLAAIIRGRARTTTDIDLILENNSSRLKKFFEKLKESNFDVLDSQVQYALQEDFNLSIYDNNSSLRLDIKIAKKLNDLNALKLARDYEYEGLKIRIVPDELILRGKIQYLGDIQTLTDKELLNFNDVLDFISIYNLHIDDLDINWLIKQTNRDGLTETLNRLVYLSKKYF